MNGSNSAPISALREQFGDQKPPDITRKITACVACRVSEQRIDRPKLADVCIYFHRN